MKRKLKEKIGIAIKNLRLSKKMSQGELADKCSLDRTYISGVERGARNITIDSLEKIICYGLCLDINVFFSFVKNISLKRESVVKYETFLHRREVVRSDGSKIAFDSKIFLSAIDKYNEKIKKLYGMDFDIASLLGMRNLSAAVGELYVQSFAEASNGLFKKNPHQDGYPDLLLMDSLGLKAFSEIEKENLLQEKARFSPFKTGGVEVKATCGAVLPPQKCNALNMKHPGLGDQRIDMLTGYDWKAHHRLTNNLIGLTWDFIDEVPVITSVQYSSQLTEDMWGKVVQPKKEGGRTTSVSIMNRKGVQAMYSGLVAVISDAKYKNFFIKYNKK